MTMAAALNPRAGGALPVIAVTGMAFEASIAAGKGGDGIEAVYAARADLLQARFQVQAARTWNRAWLAAMPCSPLSAV